MFAALIHEHGGPEVICPQEWPDPTPGRGDVVVELRAAALNFHDVLVRRDGLGVKLPRILGIDGAGVRRDTGEEVVILPSLDWGERSEVPGADWTILGDVRNGTYAELVAVPAVNVFPKPTALSWSEAAALPTAGLTAYRALFTRAQLQPGETVLVLGAGSGVSTFVVSLAASIGARAFVTSASTEKIERSIELGALGGILYTDPTWVSEVLEITGGGADVVIDAVGRETSTSLDCVRPGGRLVVFGAPVGSRATLDLRAFYFSQRSILGTTLGNAAEFEALLRSVATQQWRPVIDREFALSDAAAAHQYMEAQRQFGKIVLRCG